MLVNNAAIKGTVNMVLRGPDGRVKAHKTIRNKVMNAGIAHIVGRMINPEQDGATGKHDFPFMMRYMGIGTGTMKNLGSAATHTGDLAGTDNNRRHATRSNTYVTGWDLESGGYNGTEYKLQNEITTGARPLNAADVETFDAAGTTGTLATGQGTRLGRIDMGNFNYYDGATYTTNTDAYSNGYDATNYRWKLNFENPFFVPPYLQQMNAIPGGQANTVTLANFSKLAVQRGDGSTVDLFQGDLNAAGALRSDYQIEYDGQSGGSSTAHAEGTVIPDSGTAEVVNRINAFTKLYNFYGGFQEVFGGTSTASNNGTTPPVSDTVRSANIKLVQEFCSTNSDNRIDNGPVVPDVATLQSKLSGTPTYTTYDSQAIPRLGTFTTGTPAHVSGTASDSVTAATGKGSPPEKRHQRARYQHKKLGKRLVFIALFPPGAPFKVQSSGQEAPITEAGIFNSPTASETHQTMLCRTVFSVVTKQPEDSLQITWSIAFSDNTPGAT